MVVRLNAPQIVGVWNQILPKDSSTVLREDELERIIQFKEIHKVALAVCSIQPHVENRPAILTNEVSTTGAGVHGHASPTCLPCMRLHSIYNRRTLSA